MSMRYTREFYLAQGKDFGVNGLAIPGYWLPPFSRSWQAKAFTEGHKVGSALRDLRARQP